MRVISGKYKGKQLDGFGIPGTRPTMDRVKESLFGMIQNQIPGSTVLDLFAGTGSLGIEALSNGAKEAYFVDSGREIGKILQKNLKGIENATVFPFDYKVAIQKLSEEQKVMDIIFLDPPYHQNLLNEVIRNLLLSSIIKSGTMIICEYEEEIPQVEESYAILKKEKKYGDKNISIFMCK